MTSEVGDGIIMIVISLAFIGVMMVGIKGCEAYKCSELRGQAEIQTKWHLVNGCFVRVDGKWIPDERWRAIEGGD